MECTLERADKTLFAVCQTIYSDADIEMWYDWSRRLGDTMWTGDCFFLLENGRRIGGAVITKDCIMFPFLIPPYVDRLAFWHMLLKREPRRKINGVLNEDARLLLMLDYKVIETNRVMCRPADRCEAALPEGFSWRTFDLDTEAEAVGRAIAEGFAGGIDEELFGQATVEDAVTDLKRVCGIYAPLNLSHIVTEDASAEIVGVCTAGIGTDYTHGYAEVADLCVLPRCRGKGIARFMLGKIITDAAGKAPFVKLCVTVGNSSELLYRQMGFQPGPQFTNLVNRRPSYQNVSL